MPAHKTQLNMTALKNERKIGYPRGISATIFHSLIARDLTNLFNVDRALTRGIGFVRDNINKMR
jgi:hypothetical protein